MMSTGNDQQMRNRSKSLPAIGAPVERALFTSGKLRRKPTPNPSTTGLVTPTLSVKDSPSHIELTAELPGIQPSDVQVDIRKNLLSLCVVKTEEGTERPLGTFSEAFRLPKDADVSAIQTIGSDGKFVITIPKICATETLDAARAQPADAGTAMQM